MKDKGRQQQCKKLFHFLSIFLPLTLLLSFPVWASQQNVEIDISPSGIYAAGAAQITYMGLRITDPAGEVVFEQQSDGSPIAWNVPAGAMDGFYSYEVRLGKEAKKEKRDTTQGKKVKKRAMVESGSILIENGSVVPPTGEETGLLDTLFSVGRYAVNSVMDFLVAPAAADVVHLDDVIIDGSACVGFDCVNGESFGFDTLRLKENNLRVHFDDTSSTSSFPSNDWRIVINDTSNGGASYFAVEDSTAGRVPFRIEANAPANSLYVEDYGRIGLGTSTPLVELHIADGDTPTVRLDQDGTSGWPSQKWDVAGNESNFFIRDVTNGSLLPFRIKPGAPSNTLYLQGDGNVGIGTASPTQKLHVEGSAFISGNLELGSSKEIKNNIESLGTDEAMMTFAMLRPVKFQYKTAPEENSVGFIAEEVPDLVATNSRKSISTMDVVAVLTKVVQEQQNAIEELKKTIGQLQEKIEVNAVNHPGSIAQ
ncbi:MAG: tail fiber domain-containing protein [Proteobacteria bacterium]|nr:tail fiber domain-containing protein [Pseudomonadota bacterium]MBU1059180.1 tail fiber domain-containing protein [Pseudomonadota bacterium]